MDYDLDQIDAALDAMRAETAALRGIEHPTVLDRTALIAAYLRLNLAFSDYTSACQCWLHPARNLQAALAAVMRDCNLKESGHGGRMDQAIAAASAALAILEPNP